MSEDAGLPRWAFDELPIKWTLDNEEILRTQTGLRKLDALVKDAVIDKMSRQPEAHMQRSERIMDLRSISTSLFELNSHVQEIAGKIDGLPEQERFVAYRQLRAHIADMLASMERARGLVDSFLGAEQRPA
jgi:hypothetical protein